MEDTGETESGKSSNWTNSHSKNSEQGNSHGIEPTNPSNSLIQKAMTLKEKNVYKTNR